MRVLGRDGLVLPDDVERAPLAHADPCLHRLGDWEAVGRGNLRAAEAALAHPAGESGELVRDEFPHVIEYLVYAYLQRGDDEAAAAIARLQSTEALQPTFKTAFHLASTEAGYALERRD